LEAENSANGNTTAISDYSNQQIISKLNSFMEKHKKQFQDLSSKYCLLQRVGYKKKINGELRYYILQRFFKKEITDSQKEIDILAKNNLLIPDYRGLLCYFVDFPTGKEKVFVIRK
jgi:hypothetical protein